MKDQKIIAVTGATGAQGGGLARASLAEPDRGFSVRAITRNPGSDKALALRRQVESTPLSVEANHKLGFAGANDLGNMFQYYCDFEELVCQARSLEATRRLNPDLQDFPTWLATYAQQIPLPE